MRRLGLATFSIGLALLLPASLTLGQTGHQKCYKIKDASVKLKALADLYTPRFGFDPGCKVKSAKLLCLPAVKEVTEASNRKVPFQVQQTNLFAQGTTICYQIKCQKPFPSNQTLVDQFGTHELTKLKPNLLCVGAGPICPDPAKTLQVDTCPRFDGDAFSCNSAWFPRRNGPMSCTYNTTSNECHGCAGGSNSQPGCTNTCVACANTGLTAIPDGETCNELNPTNQTQCEAVWNTRGGSGPESCWWDGSQCKGCGPTHEVGEGNCSVTTADSCTGDFDCDLGEVCINRVPNCQNTCRAPIL